MSLGGSYTKCLNVILKFTFFYSFSFQDAILMTHAGVKNEQVEILSNNGRHRFQVKFTRIKDIVYHGVKNFTSVTHWI